MTVAEKEKSKVPQLRFPEFSGDWEKSRLGNVATFLKGKGISKADTDPEGKLECIRYGELYTHYDELIERIRSKTNLDKKALVLSKDGDVIIPASGESALDIATASCVKKEGVAYSGDLNILRSNINGLFLAYYLNNKRKYDIARYAQGASVIHLYATQMKSLLLWNPHDSKENDKIASLLSTVDKKISLLKQKHEQLVQYKKGIMQQLFSQQLRFKDDNGQDFLDWEVKKGNKIFDVISDKKHNSDLPILAITQEHGAIPRDLINYQVQVTDNSVSGYKVVDKGDYIISLRSFQGGIEYSNYKGICSPAYIILRPSIEINDDFYRYYLKTNNFIQEMKKRLEGIRDGKILSYKYFSEINLPSPSVGEQNKIADFLDAIDKKINLAQQKIEQTQAYKKGLLQQMFV